MLICICITFFNFKELIIIFTLNSEVFTSTIYVRTRSRPWDAYTQPAVSTVAILSIFTPVLSHYLQFILKYIFDFPFPAFDLNQPGASELSLCLSYRSVGLTSLSSDLDTTISVLSKLTIQ